MKKKPLGSSLRSDLSGKGSNKGAFLNMAADQSGVGMNALSIESIGGVLEQAPTETYLPPYPWDYTGTVGCQELKRMIADVEATLLTSRFVPAKQEVYQKWLAYAKERLAGMDCKDVSGDGGPIVINPPILPVETHEDIPTVDTPVKTAISAPAVSPYPVYAGGGGGGSASGQAEQPVKKSRTWIWLAVAATAAAGYFLFKK